MSSIRICTCDKKFITGIPKKYYVVCSNDSKSNDSIEYLDLPEQIPDHFFGRLSYEYYHILGCRGCKHVDKEISVQESFDDALQASILSCVYVKNEDGTYTYLSDSLSEEFEKYVNDNGLSVGNGQDIALGTE